MDIEARPIALDQLPPVSLLQSAYWGRLKAEFGWKPSAFMLDCAMSGQLMRVPLLVLVRPLAAGLSLAYVPHGPDPGGPPPGEGCECLEILSRKLKPYLDRSVMFIRYDVPWGARGEKNFPDPPCKPFRKSPVDVQPPDTVVLDLNRTPEELLAGMKPKTRYNVRLAEKKGVTVEEGGPAELEAWLALYAETARRDRITLHEPAYYRRIFALAAELGERAPRLRLFMASHEGDALAGVVTAAFRGTTTYLYGASSDKKRELMPAYLLQWRAMLQARADGSTSYDLFGIPPADDAGHAMFGLYRFKTGFGGEILHRPGSWDFAFKPAAYAGWRLAETARAFYYKKLRKLGR